MTDIKLISIIVTNIGYRDRFKLLFALDPYIKRHIIITRDPVDLPPDLRHTSIIHAGGKKQGFRFWLWALWAARRLISQSDKKQSWIVSEHFLGICNLLLKAMYGRRIRTIVSLYMTNLSFLLEKGWTADKFAGRLFWRQHLFYGGRFLRSTLMDFIGILFSDKVIVNSETILRDVKRLSNHKAVSVMQTSISIEGFADSGVNDDRFTKEKPPFVPLKLLYVGILQPHKGLGLLFYSLRRYLDNGGSAFLTLVGRQFPVDQPWLSQLLSHYDLHRHMKLTGHVDPYSLAELYQSADIFVFPSFYEGSPRVVKEALVCGCPVVASDIPGIRLIDPTGKVIQFFPAGDADSMIQKIVQLAEDPKRRRRLAEKAMDLANNFSHERIAKQLVQIYKDPNDS